MVRKRITPREAHLAAAAACGAIALAVAGCNTVEGVGEDVEATGEALDEAAEDAGDGN